MYFLYPMSPLDAERITVIAALGYKANYIHKASKYRASRRRTPFAPHTRP